MEPVELTVVLGQFYQDLNVIPPLVVLLVVQNVLEDRVNNVS